MAERIGDALFRALEIGEVLFRQQDVLAVVGQQHALVADEQHAVAPGRHLAFLDQAGPDRALIPVTLTAGMSPRGP